LNLFAAFSLEAPIVTVPIKIHIQNTLLGPHCHVDSDSEPVVLRIESLTSFTSVAFEDIQAGGEPSPEGGPLLRLGALGGTDGDRSFAVPGVSGCGFRG
jgi:hypothetical protein